MNTNNSILLFVSVLFSIFSISLSCYAETEPNNTLTNANSLIIGISESGSLGDDADVYDLYRFTTSLDGLAQTSVVPTVELRVELTLLDSDGISILGSNQGAAAGSTTGVLYNNLRSGIYYALVRTIGGTGSYSITVNFAPSGEIENEPNDVPSQALELSANGDAGGHIGFHGNRFTDKYDFYQVTTESNGRLEVTIYPDGDLNVGLQLRDTNSNEILQVVDAAGNGQSEKMEYKNLSAGTVYILVYQASGSGSYTLTSLFSGNPNINDTEPNNSISQALDLPLIQENGIYQGAVNGQLGYYRDFFQDDRDLYRLFIPVYGNLNFVTTILDEYSLSVSYVLYDEQRRLLSTSDNNTLFPGTYYLRLQRSANFGAYQLSAKLTPQEALSPFNPEATNIEPNGLIREIQLNADVLLVTYKISLPADGSLKVITTFTDTMGVFGNLYRENGEYVNRTDHWFTNDAREFTIPNLHAGIYYIQLARRDGAGSGSLQTEFIAAPNIDIEPNDAWHDQSTTVSVSDTIVGHIGYRLNGWTDTSDTFILDIPDDGSLTVTSTSDDTFGYFLNLYAMKEGSNTIYLGRNDGWYTRDKRSITKNNLIAGKYLLSMDRRDGYGNYEITFSFIPNRSGDPEPNDHSYLAVSVNPGSGAVGHIGYDQVFRLDSTDWYQVVLPVDGAFTLTTHTDASMGIFANLFHSDGTSYLGRTDHWFTSDPRTLQIPNLRAGVYYIQIIRRDGYGVYELHTKFVEQAQNDTEPNNILTMGKTLAIDEISQGALGYKDEYFTDNVDTYHFNIAAAGTYRLSWQTESSMATFCDLFTSDGRTSPFRHDRWFSSALSTRDIQFEPGNYYLQCVRRDGYGSYTLAVTGLETQTTGDLKGTVVSANNFPLAEVNCAIFERNTKTDFAGAFSFEALPPGIYTVSINSGAKYYAVQQLVEIKAGEDTQLNVTLHDSNKTAPANPEWFQGFARDRYIHFAWLPSISPDVADGGGYKLYINHDEPLDFGNILSYRSDGFLNGVEYTCRLTVYDKFGNESDGKTVFITPRGDIVEPLPTPTKPIQPTATPTVTPTKVLNQPTPTNLPTSIPIEPSPVSEPYKVYEFEQANLDANGWAEIPGGFGSAPSGAIFFQFPISTSQIPTSEDGKGLAVLVRSKEVTFILCKTAIDTGGRPALIRAVIRANDPNAAIVLGALKGEVLSGQNVDGSISMEQRTSAASIVDEAGRMVMLFQPDTGTMINPFIQVASTGTTSVNVFIDRLDIYILEEGETYPASLFLNKP